MTRAFHHTLRRLHPCLSWGTADNLHLGLPKHLLHPESETVGLKSPTPQEIPQFQHKPLQTASISASHAAFLRTDGTLHTCGDGTSGQLGFHARLQPEPTCVSGLGEVTDVACGGRHTVAVADGVVYGFGCNRFGQLGVEDGGGMGVKMVKVLVEDGRRMVGIAAGADFTVGVCEEGGVYTWGNGDGGCLGHGEGIGGGFFGRGLDRVECLPRKVRGLDGVRVRRVYAGLDCVVAVDGEGVAYCWGKGRNFQLGDGGEEDRWEPGVGYGGMRVRKVVMGGTHALVLTEGGTCWAVGRDVEGCLGGGYEGKGGEMGRLGLVEGLGVVSDVAAGWGVSAAVGEGGEVFMWGCGNGGALGDGEGVHHWAPRGVGVRAGGVAVARGGSSVLAFW